MLSVRSVAFCFRRLKFESNIAIPSVAIWKREREKKREISITKRKDRKIVTYKKRYQCLSD